MSDTPRTDAMIDSCGDYEKWHSYRDRLHKFARRLERENAELRGALNDLVTQGELSAAGTDKSQLYAEVSKACIRKARAIISKVSQ